MSNATPNEIIVSSGTISLVDFSFIYYIGNEINFFFNDFIVATIYFV